MKTTTSRQTCTNQSKLQCHGRIKMEQNTGNNKAAPQVHNIPARKILLRTEKKPGRELERQDGPKSSIGFGKVCLV